MRPDAAVRAHPAQRIAVAAAFLLACSPMTSGDFTKAGPDVRSTLRAQGRVAVMIALVEPEGYGSSADTASLRSEIARAQQQLLSRLDARDYRPGKRFENVPALAGIVLSERGLERLLADPSVKRVDVDAGGGGSVSPLNRSARVGRARNPPAWNAQSSRPGAARACFSPHLAGGRYATLHRSRHTACAASRFRL
jgi:hypothetical protein